MPDSYRAIEVENLTKTYKGRVRALDGLTFSVEAGTVFALLGPNGAGKSTAIKILTTLARPDSGVARVAGIDVVRNAPRVRSVIGCVAQKSGVDLESTARENLMLQGRLHGLPAQEAHSVAGRLLTMFNLNEAADKVAVTYSGGMLRKLDIAIGLVHRPQVLFLDEPTTGLDPEARTELWQEIVRLRTNGLTILLTTHYLEEADQLAQHVAIVDHGKLAVEGKIDSLKAELQSEVIEIELFEEASGALVASALGRLEQVKAIRYDGCSLRIRTSQSTTTVPHMLLALEAQAIRVASIKVSKPSLDDVYFRHTGRGFVDGAKEWNSPWT
jgi:ABC-2 type transport system ATP-binding protein